MTDGSGANDGQRRPVVAVSRLGVPFRSGPPADPPSAPSSPWPEAIATLVAGAVWEQTWVKPESEVWRVERPAGAAYLKVIDDPDEFAGEVGRLRWLAGRSPIPTPPVLADATDGAGRGWVLTAELPGVPAHDPALVMQGAAPLVDAIGHGLRAWHDALPVADCPFTLGVDDLVASAGARVARGGVDPATMASATYRRLSAERLLEHLLATRPDTPAADLVVAHGDPVQPNLLVDAVGGRLGVAGVVDVGRLGLSDRYRDLAIAVRSLAMNLDGEAAARFLDAYGIDHPDARRLEWYALVDDLW